MYKCDTEPLHIWLTLIQFSLVGLHGLSFFLLILTNSQAVYKKIIT